LASINFTDSGGKIHDSQDDGFGILPGAGGRAVGCAAGDKGVGSDVYIGGYRKLDGDNLDWLSKWTGGFG
jgi:hypothetical protein